MLNGHCRMVVALIIAGPQLWACSESKTVTATKVEPAKLERSEGSPLGRVTLTARAAERLGVETAPVRVAPVASMRQAVASADELGQPVAVPPTAERKVVPYAAVVYEPHGDTWVYTNPEPLVFVRAHVTIDYIDGDVAVLSEGPPVGTAVATVGVAELFGVEFGVK
jgi:hypothetical protein